jgi:putative ABC transport system permease protein
MNKESIINPPALIRKAFIWWCKRADAEDLIGDIDEFFYHNLEQKGKLKAQIIYLKQVLSLSLSYSLKKRKRSAAYSSYYSNNSMTMFKNYFKIAVRNFAKQKLFTTINVFGLAIGMSVSLLILGVLSQVMQYDDFHTNKDKIHRVVTNLKDIEGQRTYATTARGVYEALSKNYPGIKAVVRIDYIFDPVVLHQDNEIELSAIFTDPNYFEVFSFDLERGNETTALLEPFSMVISRSVAEKLYPDEDPMGKVIHTKKQGDYKITGVLKEHPRQTHLGAEVLISYSSVDLDIRKSSSVAESWQDLSHYYVYLLLDEKMTASDFLPALSNLTENANAFLEDKSVAFELQAFTNISPGRYLFRDNTHFDWLGCVGLFGLGLLILIPACLNYTNLMIARALKRAKEIGIRKIVGSNRRQIVHQFIVEAVILTVMALIGSIVIFTAIRQEFLDMLIGSETLDLSLTPSMIIWFVVFGLLTGFFAGLFPALYFSKMEPLQTLKGELGSKSISISTVRKSLIVVQFTLSLGFIIGIGVILKQHKDILDYNLGFDKNGVLAVPLKSIDQQLLVNEYSSVAGVKEISLSSNMPGVETGLTRSWVYQIDNKEDSIRAYQVFIDENFIPSLDFKMKWGENFNRLPSKTNELFLVNETFMKKNKTLNPDLDSLSFLIDGKQKGYIAGVVKDYNFMQLNMTIMPLIIRYNPEKANYALIKIDHSNMLATIDELEAKWITIDQNLKFESFFLDHKIEESYEMTSSMIKIFGFLGTLSLTISCIGLLGMVVYFTENHIKEVAIRKIMGASLMDLYVVLGSSFFKLLVIAIAIATPISYLFYDKLLANLINKYSVGVGWLELVLSILFMFILGLFPILWMVFKISNINPATNLRQE